MAVPAAPVRVPSQRPLAPSVASVMSVANDKGDKALILGAVHRSPGIYLTAEENPRKPQLGDRLMIRVIMKWSWGLYTDLLAFTLQPRKTPGNLS